MVEYRFVIPNYNGERIEGPWIKDVPYYIIEAAKVWIAREVTFIVEFH